MFVPMMLASVLKEKNPDIVVKNHAITRSPIMVSNDRGRVVDNNTAIDKQADINDIEFLWRKRFGIDLSIMERLNRLLDDTDKWVFDWGNKKYCYHINSPEFQIVQMEDMQQGWVPAAAFYAHPVMYFARLNVMYHNTTIYESVLWSFDEFRKYLPENVL